MEGNYTLYWQSADKTHDIAMGEYPTAGAARAAIPAARATLLAQVGEKEQADDLTAGGWVVVWGAQLQRYGWDEGNEEGRGK